MVRLVSGVILAAAAIAAILFLPLDGLRLLAVITAALAAHEYLIIAGVRGRRRQWTAVLATALLCGTLAWEWRPDATVVLLIALAWLAAEVLFDATPVEEAAAALLAPVYLAVPLALLVLVHSAHGAHATLLLIAVIIVSDSSQYYTGRAFGRRPLAPAISPKKTVEGAVGGLVLGTAFAAAAGRWLFPESGLAGLVILGAALVLLGIGGDLFESRLKRAAGVKDSSSLIPGHGGILDRIDALLFAAPAFFLYVRG